MNSMIYNYSNGIKIHALCASCKPMYERGMMPVEGNMILTYYSKQEAVDKGWLETNNIKYCPPDRSFVWVCPSCQGKEIKTDAVIITELQAEITELKEFRDKAFKAHPNIDLDIGD